MELPNHKIIHLNNFDTPETIRNKIAVQYNIDPKYINKLKIPYNLYSQKEWPSDVYIMTILDALRQSKAQTFAVFYKYTSPIFDLMPQELVNIWKQYYINAETQNDKQLTQILDDELKTDINNLEVLYPIEFAGVHIKNIDTDLSISSKLINELKIFDIEIDKFEKLPIHATTKFEQKKQYITITIQSSELNYPFEYLFDKIILNENIPLVIYNEYCKIYKTFILNGKIPSYENNIVLLYKKSNLEYMNQEDDEEDEDENEDEDQNNHDEDHDYRNDAKHMWYKLYNIITIHRDNIENIIIEMEIDNNVNIDNIIKNIKQVLNWDIEISTLITTNKISGEFYVIHQIMDPIITKDIILFHPVLKNIMYSNDNIIAPDSNITVIGKYKYKNIIHYIDPITKNKFICHISTRTATRNNLINYAHIYTDLKIGDPITVFKIIRGANISIINYFQNIIGRLVNIYNEHSLGITEQYSKFVNDINTRVFVSKKESLTDILPNIFPEQYSRLCAKQKIPQIIQADVYKNDNSTQLEFPKNDDNSNYFECNSNDYPYIGLVSNKLSNKTDYPYLPCCFKLDQKNNTESNYYKYYYKNDMTSKQKQEYERILQTQKFAKFGAYGVLPENIFQLFSILDKNNEYYRRGIHFQNVVLEMSSFLECVLDAINWNNILQYAKDETEREKIIKNERLSISTFIKNSGLCKQECYNLSLTEIEENIKNINHYLSPLLYIRAVEEFYNINIFIFQRDLKTPRGNLIIPNHEPNSNYLFTPLKSRQTIIIYEHIGGIWENKYSCELIIRFNPKTLKTITLFNHDDKIVSSLYQQLLQMYSNYQGNVNILPVEPPNIKNIKSQYIDNFGKVRYLTYIKPDSIIHCQPIPPLNVPVDKTVPTIQGLKEFISTYKLQKHGDNAYITNDSFQIFTANQSITSNNLDLNIFVRNKRVSIHLLEYLLYLYSQYIKNKSGSGSGIKTNENIKEFLEKHTIVNTIDNKLNYNINFLVQENPKIIEIDSLEMRSKLNYMIRVHLLNNRKLIANYYNQNYLNNFYNSILDFKENPNQELICTRILYTIYNNLYETKLQLYPPDHYINNLFFYRYRNMNFLAQPTKTLDEALIRLYNWHSKSSNTINILQEIPIYPFICIPYTNKKYDKLVKVDSGNPITKNDVYILYCYTDSSTQSPYFIALLNISS